MEVPLLGPSSPFQPISLVPPARPNHEVTTRWPLCACRAGPPRQPASPRPHRDQVVAVSWGLAVILHVPVPPSLSLPRLQLGPSVGTAPADVALGSTHPPDHCHSMPCMVEPQAAPAGDKTSSNSR
jgi:hypothetical protein